VLEAAADDRPIDEEIQKADPLDQSTNAIMWKAVLADGLAKANGCRTYNERRRSGTAISIVGPESRVAAVRYLYLYLCAEIERLAKQYAGFGRAWLHAWRVGCATMISQRLHAACEEAREEALRNAGTADQRGVALVRVNAGLARLDAQNAAVEAWVEANLKLKSVKMKISGLKGISVADEIEIEIKGKVVEIAQRDTEFEWENGQTLCLEPTSCDLHKPGKETSIEEAIEGSRKKV